MKSYIVNSLITIIIVSVLVVIVGTRMKKVDALEFARQAAMEKASQDYPYVDFAGTSDKTSQDKDCFLITVYNKSKSKQVTYEVYLEKSQKEVKKLVRTQAKNLPMY